MSTEAVKNSDLNPAAARPAARRAARRTEQATGRGFRLPVWLFVVLALVIGVGIGALAARQRYKGREKEVVLSVNGENITKDQFYRRLELVAGVNTLRQMSEEKMTLQFAKKLGTYPSDAEVEAKYAEAMKRADVKESLRASGQTADEYKYGLRIALATANSLSKGASVSDAEVKQFYEANIRKNNPTARYYIPETSVVAVIVTRTEDECKKALSELTNGMPFNRVVEKYTMDQSTRNTGGVLPPIQKGRTQADRIAGLESAIFGLKIGQQIGPRKFADGWWIIRCLERKEAQTLPFDQVKEECRTQVLLSKGAPKNARAMEEEFANFRKTAKVQAFWRQYAAVENKN
jgi:parvulin-like peptidyl-prolyl isomerase